MTRREQPLPEWKEMPIGKHHDRTAFDCGDAALNGFLRLHARQNHQRGAAKTFVAAPVAHPATVLGFYSLCPASLEYAKTPELLRKGLARHEVPVFRLVRLAVDLSIQGRGLGGQLLVAAGRRCLQAATEVGGVALLIDAKDQRAADWYAAFGALPLLDQPLSLVLPLATIQQAGR
jgi:GNAT superfamily N-acetyltransferase